MNTNAMVKLTPQTERRLATGIEPTVFTDIYQDDVNIAVWQRDLKANLQQTVCQFLDNNPSFQCSITVSPSSAKASLSDIAGLKNHSELIDNIVELVDMFCCLFELSHTGIRLTALNKAMCPKFHVDRVPCRLVTTYQGIATQWLTHALADRSKLGAASHGLEDHESGIYQNEKDIQQLSTGDVALLKGEHWYNNEGAGLVHRSPALEQGENRLLLTLDFADG